MVKSAGILACSLFFSGLAASEAAEGSDLIQEMEELLEKHKNDKATLALEKQLKAIDEKVSSIQTSIQKLDQKFSGETHTQISLGTPCPQRESAPPEDLCCDPCSFEINPVFDLHFLYWQTLNRDLRYGILGSITGAFGDFQEIDSESAPGFRVGLGLKTYEDWYLNLNYTYYHNHSDNLTSEDPALPNDGIIPIYGLGGTFAQAKGVYLLNYNVGDLFFENTIWVKNSVQIIPRFGATGASINERFRISYNMGSDQTISERTKSKLDWWGVGMKGGSAFRFLMPQNFYFTGESYLGLYLGNGETSFKSRRITSDGIWAETTDLSSSSMNLTPSLQTLLGLGWDYACNPCYRIGLSVCWEFNYWWEIWNDFGLFLPVASPPEVDIVYRSLKLQGLNFMIDFGF